MPFVRSGATLIYFAHVPKCAGSTVERYLEDRFGQLAMVHKGHSRTPPRDQWSKSSPQHIDAASLSRMFPPGFFDAVFAVVRHPVTRMVSTYHFQREVEGLVPDGQGFSDWLTEVAAKLADTPWIFDNQVRPMSDIVPQGAEIFPLEDGLERVVGWLDRVTEGAGAAATLGRVNARADRKKTVRAEPELSSGDIDLILRLHAADFERFGYDPANITRPVLPAAAPRRSGVIQTLGRRLLRSGAS